MGDVTLISSKEKKEDDPIKVVVHYKNGDEKEYMCDYIAHSSEYPVMLVLLDGESFPVCMINSNEIIKMDIFK